MRLVEFQLYSDGDTILVNPEYVISVREPTNGRVRLNVRGLVDTVHVRGTLAEVRATLEGPPRKEKTK